MGGDKSFKQALLALLSQTGDDGEPRFSRDEVVDFLAIYLLSGELPPMGEGAVNDERALLEFSAKVGISPQSSPEEAAAAIKAYLDQHPLELDARMQPAHLLAQGSP